jgi:hypothetical protein
MNLTHGDTGLILETCRDYGLSLAQTAYVLATTWHETNATMRPVEEAYWVKNADAWRAKNLRYYPWHGRGYVQLTWQANYLKAGKALNVDLTTDPDLAMRAEIAAPILVQGMQEGWFTGKKLADYISGSKKDYIEARRIVNGTDRASLIAGYAREYEKLLGPVFGQPRAPQPVPPPATQPAPVSPFVAWLRRLFGVK